MFGLFQPMHLIIILAIALVIFGPKRLPELGAGLGKSLREFQRLCRMSLRKLTLPQRQRKHQKKFHALRLWR